MCWKWKSRTSARCATASSTSSSPPPSHRVPRFDTSPALQGRKVPCTNFPPPFTGEVAHSAGGGGLLLDLRHGPVGVFALRAILPECAQQRRIRRGVEHRVVLAGVDVTAPEEVRQRHDVVLF